MENPAPPARRRINTSMTEDHWLAAMADFEGGMTDGEVAQKWRVSNATVAAQRYKRGVYRRDRSAPSVGEMQAVAAERQVELTAARTAAAEAEAAAWAEDLAAGEAGPALDEGEDDPVAGCDALLALSRRLFRDGKVERAVATARLARSHLLALRVRREVLEERAEGGAAAAESLPAPPKLRVAQTPPEGDWRTWLFLGGRGAGKTLAGAAWLAGRAKVCARLALVGPTIGDVREVMIEGPSGLRGLGAAFGPEGGPPRYEPSRRRLIWPNQAVAYVFTAEDPDGLRGPQFEAAWADELCAWPRSASKTPEETLAMLRMGLRLGATPQLVLTTTPRPTAGLAKLIAEPGLAQTRGSALENAEHLAPGFVDGLRALYGGTRLERQEIDGEVLEALEGAVFRRAEIDRARARAVEVEAWDALVVAVDPPAGLDGAACGIVVAGRPAGPGWAGGRSTAVVLEDVTVHGLSPLGWASRVAAAAERWAARGPVRVVAEANQGGEMVRQVLANAGLTAPIRLVHAVAGKAARAEPVALLYEQGRVAHVAGLDALEDQMLLLGAAGARDGGGKSPDRADALVWALTALLLQAPDAQPRIRKL